MPTMSPRRSRGGPGGFRDVRMVFDHLVQNAGFRAEPTHHAPLQRQDQIAGFDRGWPVRFDHCFQRILLDNSVGAKWRDLIASPAYINAPVRVLRDAVDLGEACAAGRADLAALNRRSLEWRGKL